jgi:hypothetical protein
VTGTVTLAAADSELSLQVNPGVIVRRPACGFRRAESKSCQSNGSSPESESSQSQTIAFLPVARATADNRNSLTRFAHFNKAVKQACNTRYKLVIQDTRLCARFNRRWTGPSLISPKRCNLDSLGEIEEPNESRLHPFLKLDDLFLRCRLIGMMDYCVNESID